MEAQTIEWKEIWKDEYLAWLCGYANAKGGVLVIGKDDKGNVKHVENAEKLLVDLPNKIRDVLGIIVDIDIKYENEKQYLEISVPAYSHGISYKGDFHYRSGSTKQVLKGTALSKFLLERNGQVWDKVRIPTTAITQLDEKSFDLFRTKASKTTRLSIDDLSVDNQTLLEKLNLVSDSSLTRAAILLFHPNPEKIIAGAYIKIGSFSNDNDVLSHDEIYGSLFVQIEDTIQTLVNKYLGSNISFEGISRVEKYPYPMRALREAIINAIAHKDYACSNPILIKVYANSIQIFNEGALPNDWTMEQFLGNHPSIPANPTIAQTLYRAGYIEAWGTGISTILKECNNNNLPLPSFDISFGGLTVILKQQPIKEKPSSLHILLSHYFDSLKDNTISEKNIEDFAPLAKKLEDKSLSLMLALEDGDLLKRKEMMNLIELTNQTYNVDRYLTPLLELGLIAQVIKSRPNSPNQRYRLTEKGLKFKYLLTKITTN